MKVGTGVDDGRWGTWWGRIDPETALPIQLSYFHGTVTGESTVELRWGTLSETNNYGFEVEKSPNVPSSYQTIPNSFIPGHGTTLEPQHYAYTDHAAAAGLWWYRLKQMDLDGTVHFSDGVQVDVVTGVAIATTPGETALLQNSPNPFNPSTTIRYTLARRGHTTLKILDVLGREVATLVNGEEEAGDRSVDWNAAGLASGVYFYRLEAGSFLAVKKLLLLK